MPLKMRLDSQEFTLSNESLLAMAQSLLKTRVKERGFMLCQGFAPGGGLAGEITPGQEHIGGPGAISVRDCHSKAIAGHFHTHPQSDDSAPSWHDAYSILWMSRRYGPYIGCRAGTADKTIRCDTLKRPPTDGEMAHLKRKQSRMRFTDAQRDPDIWQYMGPSYSIQADRIPDIIRVQPKEPEKPAERPRIFTVFANKRSEVARLIQSQFPEITGPELDNARITYHNGSAMVEL